MYENGDLVNTDDHGDRLMMVWYQECLSHSIWKVLEHEVVRASALGVMEFLCKRVI